MHINVKKLARMSVFAAFSVVLLFLGEIISINTLFFIAGASFFVGIIQVEYGGKSGLLFFFVCLTLSLLLLPNKIHCITYFVFSFNIWFRQYSYFCFQRMQKPESKKYFLYITCLIVFNLTYIPIILFFPKLFIEGEISERLIVIAILFGQVGYFVLCYAFRRFEIEIWKRWFADRYGGERGV